MVVTNEERSHRAELQRARRLAKRSCGYCGEPAAAMVTLGGQQTPFCGTCQANLDGPAAPTPWCAFHEVNPVELRPQATPMAILVEARLLPAPEVVVQEPRPSLVGRIIQAAGRVFRPRNGRRTLPAISGESD